MKIYAIYVDNGQSYEDHYYGIMKDHIYLDPFKAREECDKLNLKIPPEITTSQWIESDTGLPFEDYKDSELECWQITEGDIVYSVVEYNVI